MKQEYVLVIIIGFLILAYVLDAIVNPLTINLTTPYHFFDPNIVFKYPFTSVSITLKALALFLGPLWFLSFLDFNKVLKGGILLVLSGLMQLYALQDVVSKTGVLPLEWSLALTFGGLLLLIVAIFYMIAGFIGKAGSKLSEESPDPFDFKKEDL